jgi:PKD domain
MRTLIRINARIGFRTGLFVTMVIVALCAVPIILRSRAATPGNGTVSTGSPQVSYTGGPFFAPNASDSSTGVTCDQTDPCDDFALTVNLPADYATTHPNDTLKFEVSWNDPTGVQDLDVYLLDSQGNYAKIDADTSNPEIFSIPAGAGLRTYTVRVAPSLTTGQAYNGKVSLVSPASASPTPTPPAGPVPRYYNYAAPTAIGEAAGEPSIGYNLTSHRAMYIAGLQTLQVTFPENISPMGTTPEACDANWKDVSFIWTKTISLDPILFTDQRTGRTWVSQLDSVVPPASPVLIGLNSFMAFTDDDGAHWTPAQVNPPDGSYDHETVGAGPYPSPIPSGINPIYPDAVYYCAQAGVTAFCSRSDDGGLNFGRAMPAYTAASTPAGPGCGGIHGHVKVGPDGTVYLPNRGCNGTQAMSVSTDAGTTWTVRQVRSNSFSSTPPPGILDPSVGFASDNTAYFCYVNGDGHPHVAVSKDRGASWINDRDIGASQGIQNAVFVESVAGNPDRAACGFIGTTTAGNHEDANFKGTWYAFIAHTYDGGASWTTVNATPNDPVQRQACIWNEGGSNVCRNLLDFNEITMDEKGRVLYSYADGCIGDCASGGPNSFSSKATIARQSGGNGLLSAFDSAEPVVAQRPCLSGRRDDMASYLRWIAPDSGGSDITDYKLFRGQSAGTEVYNGQHVSGKTTYTDRSVDPVVPKYTYKLTAVNGVGESLPSNIVELLITPRVEPTGACALPGVQSITDPTTDEADGQTQHDITSVSMSEPLDNATTGAASKLVFTIKAANLAAPILPGWRWSVRFNVPGFPPPSSILGASDDWFVAMVTSDNATPTFTYGVTGVPQGAARFFSTIGNLDPASNEQPDGTITLVLPKSAIGNLQPGQPINLTLGSVRATGPSQLPETGGTNYTIPDITGPGSYTLRQANLCLPNTAPIAQLNATSPDSGAKPLTVNFDGSASSDADPIDTIASYTFNFGDGGDDVTQASPTISHTFDKAGEYPVKLVVTDSRGKVSSNTAQHLVEVTGPCTRFNVALASNLSNILASSSQSSGLYPATSAIDGDRTGNNWGNNGGWNDSTRGVFPDSLEVDFPTSDTIDEIDVITLQNNWTTAGQPDLTTSCSGEGILDFDVQYWNGQQWVTVPNGSVTGNDKAWRQFTFAAITTTKIRVVVNNARNNYSRIVELEAYGCPT